MSHLIRWLHLSDFHVGKDDYGQIMLFRHILKQVKSRVVNTRLDFVFITGDVAQSGTAAQYDLFLQDCLAPLQQLVGPECQVMIVPGNHDLDRTQAEFVSRDSIQNSLNFFDASELGRQKRQAVMPRFQAYHEKLPFPSPWLDTAQGCFVVRKTIRGVDIGILGLNTAWLAEGDDKAFLSPGKNLVEAGLAEIEGAHVRIVLGHHPIDWFSERIQSQIQALLGQANAIYLHGHLHQAKASLHSGAGELYLALQSGSAFQVREHDVWRNRMLWAALNVHEHTLEIDPFTWHAGHQEWALDGDAFPMRFHQNGYWVLPLPGERTFSSPVRNDSPLCIRPNQGEETFADEVIQLLNRGQLVVILSQSGRKVHVIKQKLLEVTSMLFDDAQVIQLSPALDPDISVDRYFQSLGKQAGFDACMDCIDWTDGFEAALSNGRAMVLLMSHFENGSDKARDLLAKALRQLWDKHNPRFKIVLFGGHELARQVYGAGDMSILNVAANRLMPELTFETLACMAGAKDVTDEEAQRILAVTGGHPLLVGECLGHIGRDYQAMLNQSALPSRLFVRFRRKKQDRDKICRWLQCDVLASFEHWPMDKVLRRLYWDNLLTERNQRFVWRCALIRQWGIQQLSGL